METAAFYFKLMEKFCDGRVVVQDKTKKRRGGGGNKKKKQQQAPPKKQQTQEDLEAVWDSLSSSIAAVLAGEISLPEEEHPIPFDAAADKSIDDQK